MGTAHNHLTTDEPFSRIFPSTPTGTPKPIDKKPTPDDLDGENTGDELEKLGQMEGMPESVSLDRPH